MNRIYKQKNCTFYPIWESEKSQSKKYQSMLTSSTPSKLRSIQSILGRLERQTIRLRLDLEALKKYL